MIKTTGRVVLFTISLLVTQYAAASDSLKVTLGKVLAMPDRSDADRERDQRDYPQVVLEAAGFSEGMTVADVFGGSGYYSQILANVVGENGKVLLVNNPPYDAYVKKDLDARRDAGGLENVVYSVVSNDDLGLTAGTLDGALIIMSYHDLFYADPDSGWPAIHAEDFMGQIVTALKPGGRLLIVDHAAKAGSGSEAALSLHRIEESFATEHLSKQGLRLLTTSAVLRNPQDDRTASAFDPEIRGKTDRFVHVYEKP